VQEEILHFVQNDKLTYVIINKRFIINIQPKSVSLSKLLKIQSSFSADISHKHFCFENSDFEHLIRRLVLRTPYGEAYVSILFLP